MRWLLLSLFFVGCAAPTHQNDTQPQKTISHPVNQVLDINESNSLIHSTGSSRESLLTNATAYDIVGSEFVERMLTDADKALIEAWCDDHGLE